MAESLSRPHVVVVGAGFGGLRAVRSLAGAPVRVTLVDRNNYHLFQPLLYQVATAGLEPGQIAKPVRSILRRQTNLEFRLAEVRRVDLSRRTLHTSRGDLSYDYLILAPGSEPAFFGLEGVERHSVPLKDLPDGVGIRNHVLTCFEQAVHEADEARRKSLLTFVVVGGGPTGVEMAGALSELIRLVLLKDYPQLSADEVEIVLLEAQDRLLPGFPPRLSDNAARTLRGKGVEVMLGAAVADYDGRVVRLKGGAVIACETVIWAAGVRAARLVEGLPAPRGRQGRIRVEPSLQLPGHPEVYVIGDAAYLEESGEALPMMAPVAMQMAETAAANLLRQVRGAATLAFRYRNPGSLATIGRNAAVAHIFGIQFTGFVAWVVWLVVHLVKVIGFRNRLLVLINWAWDYFFYDRGVRLIGPE